MCEILHTLYNENDVGMLFSNQNLKVILMVIMCCQSHDCVCDVCFLQSEQIYTHTIFKCTSVLYCEVKLVMNPITVGSLELLYSHVSVTSAF